MAAHGDTIPLVAITTFVDLLRAQIRVCLGGLDGHEPMASLHSSLIRSVKSPADWTAGS